MKRHLICGAILALGLPGSGRAQEVVDEWEEGADDDYDMYFGDQHEAERSDGPASLKEAIRQGRGYRIGGGSERVDDGEPLSRPESDVHTVVEGDTLWGIAERYYRDPWQWPRLWSYNPEITNPHWIYPLDQVRLAPNAQSQGEAAVASAESTQTGAALPMPSRAPVARDGLEPGTVFLRDQGYLDPEALKAAGQIVAASEEQRFLSHVDEVYVKFAKNADVRAGQEYSVFQPVKKLDRAPQERGRLVRIYGTVTIRSFDRQKALARGVLSEAVDPIERGFHVAQVERRFDLVPPKRNTANVIAHVIASVRPRAMLTHSDVVFLDVGRGSGVEPGNRLFVVRQGDAYMEAVGGHANRHPGGEPLPSYDRESLPKEVVAELRVVKVNKETTVALVTRSDTEIYYGDVAEMRAGF